MRYAFVLAIIGLVIWLRSNANIRAAHTCAREAEADNARGIREEGMY